MQLLCINSVQNKNRARFANQNIFNNLLISFTSFFCRMRFYDSNTFWKKKGSNVSISMRSKIRGYGGSENSDQISIHKPWSSSLRRARTSCRENKSSSTVLGLFAASSQINDKRHWFSFQDMESPNSVPAKSNQGHRRSETPVTWTLMQSFRWRERFGTTSSGQKRFSNPDDFKLALRATDPTWILTHGSTELVVWSCTCDWARELGQDKPLITVDGSAITGLTPGNY
jgi:hypothetical protein